MKNNTNMSNYTMEMAKEQARKEYPTITVRAKDKLVSQGKAYEQFIIAKAKQIYRLEQFIALQNQELNN